MNTDEIKDGDPLYKATVSTILTGWGLHVYVFEGKAQRYSGGVCVLHDAGASYDLDNWHRTKEEALAKAADQVELLISPAVRQVERLREGVTA